MKAVLKIIEISRISKAVMAICIAMAIISSAFAVVPAQFFGFAVTCIADIPKDSFIYDIIMRFDKSSDNYRAAVIAIILFLFSSILFILFRNLFCYIAIVTSQKIIINVRKELFAKLTNIDFKEVAKRSKGDIIYILMNDTQRLEYIFERPFYTIFSDIFDFIFVVAFLIYIDPAILLILLITTPFICIFGIKTAKIQKQTSYNMQAADSKITVRIEQFLSGYETIKSFNAENLEQQRFAKSSDISYANRKAGVKSLSVFMPIEGILSTLGICAILLYAVYQIKWQALPVGMIVVFADYSRRFYNPVKNISNYLQTIQKALVSINKIVWFLNIKDEMHNNPPKSSAKFYDVSVAVKNLMIYLDDIRLVNDISFECKGGELLLIKGCSGSGKTSIIRTIMGLYKIPNGMIFINGADINSYANQNLRAAISYCGQKAFLHDDTIINNIFYPCEKRDLEKIQIYLEKMGLQNLDLHETIGDNGDKLSGGEKSRIAFIRAVMKNSKILLLDEASASLDKDNENAMIDILKELKQNGWAIIFCSHSNNKKLYDIADKIVNIEAQL